MNYVSMKRTARGASVAFWINCETKESAAFDLPWKDALVSSK
jgi:hypothetical protein